MQQECIPVGCVLPTLYHNGGHCPGRSLSKEGLCPRGSVFGGGSLSKGVSVWGRGASVQWGLPDRDPRDRDPASKEHGTRDRNTGPVSQRGNDIIQRPPSPRRGRIDTCKNITLPQTSFAGGKTGITPECSA